MNRELGKYGLFVCPCCGYATLTESLAWEICKICFWEDDGQDDPKANESWGGPNKVSLSEGRKNFLVCGVSDPKHKEHVRDINPDDERVRQYSLKDETVVVLNASQQIIRVRPFGAGRADARRSIQTLCLMKDS